MPTYTKPFAQAHTGAIPTRLPCVAHSWQLSAVLRQDRHFQSQGVHLSSSVLNLQVVRHVGLAESQKAQEDVAPLPVHKVERVGDC